MRPPRFISHIAKAQAEAGPRPVRFVSPGPAPASSGPARSSGYNCSDFPLADGTSAQTYLDLYPDDPSGLDGDNDDSAKVYVYDGVPFQHADPFFRGQNRARRAKTGLWGPPCNGDTTKPGPSVRQPAPGPSAPRSGCDPNYSGACIPVYPPDVNCGDISARNFRVVGTDVHHLDVDHDGVACEE